MPRQEQGIESYFTPSGEKRYRVRWREGGKQPSRSFRRLSREHGARAFYQKVRQVQEAGARLVEAGAAELTLAAFVADVWAPRARRRLAAKTWETDSRIYNKHVLHQLGDRAIAELDAEDLVEWQDELEQAGIGRRRRIKAMSILSSVFREAARRSRSTGCGSTRSACSTSPPPSVAVARWSGARWWSSASVSSCWSTPAASIPARSWRRCGTPSWSASRRWSAAGRGRRWRCSGARSKGGLRSPVG